MTCTLRHVTISARLSVPTSGPCGLRERKKARTRDAMLAAALQRFRTDGYEATTVRSIAQAADVSERTFFRYFASKEDLILSLVIAAADEFIAALRVRPADEQPIDAMRQALRDALGALDAESARSQTEAFAAVVRLIEQTPALLAAHLRQMQECGDRVARVLAEREGVPVGDPRPVMLVSVFASLATVAHREWSERGYRDSAELVELIDAYFDQLPTLGQHWDQSIALVRPSQAAASSGGSSSANRSG
jgi:AcrR family transcriptional regulator